MRRRQNDTLSPETISKPDTVSYELGERDEDEYYYYSHVGPSPAGDEHCPTYDEELASETATLNFYTDDREDCESVSGTAINNSPKKIHEKKSTSFRRPITEPITNASNSSNNLHKCSRMNGSTAAPLKCLNGIGSQVNEIHYEYLDEEEIHDTDIHPLNHMPNVNALTSVQERRRMNNRSDVYMPYRSQYDEPIRARSVRIEEDPTIDYSSRSFRDAKAAIDAAAQKSAASNTTLQGRGSSNGNRTYVSPPILKTGNHNAERESPSLRFVDNVDSRGGEPSNEPAAVRGMRVRRIGDTTIVTHHRDPYSFYWQLDKARKRNASPSRRRHAPPTTIVDEASEEDEAIDVVDEEPTPVEKIVLSPDSNDSGVNVESYYAKPFREPLPAGWEKHKDPSGYSYYWHVDSGVIQRDPPSQPRERSPPRVATPPANVGTQPPAPLVMEEHAYRQTTTKRRMKNSRSSDAKQSAENRAFDESGPCHMRFSVRSLGGVELEEKDLMDADASSHAVNTAISRLSKNADEGTAAVAGRWNNGAPMFLDLDTEERLTLLDARTEDVLMTTRVQNIRVWGVGKENPNDFAFVTRNPRTHNFFCHVFSCEDAPALEVANALRNTCARIIHSRHTTTQRPTSLKVGSKSNGALKRVTRESLLLTPVDEPKRIIRCQFIGITQVPKATGIDTLNEAVDRLVREVGADRWLLADVSVAPSTILIYEATPTAPLGGTLTRARPPVAECRVRFLSFLGVGRDVKHCAFIMHNANADTFLCYVFRVEPNAALMAKTIEAACKLRYQKVLDAHLGRAITMPSTTTVPITKTTTYTN